MAGYLATMLFLIAAEEEPLRSLRAAIASLARVK
jgi:hypothetical protein